MFPSMVAGWSIPMTSAALCVRNTKLITIMMANNETGVLQPVEEIGKIAAEADVYFHTDAVQAAGKGPDRRKAYRRVTCFRFPGTSCTRRREWARFTFEREPFFSRCFMAEVTRGRGAPARRMFRESSVSARRQNWPEKHWSEAISHACQQCGIILEQKILSEVEATGVNGEGAPRVPNTTNIHFDYIEGEALVIALDLKGLAVSTGAACSSGAIEPSHVLTAMGLPPEVARASLRFSLGKQNTPEDVQFALEPDAANGSPPARAVAGLQ